MKVNVLTAEDVTIAPYRWWSDWIDISVFGYGYTGHLLQMKVSRRNSKKFKVTPFKSRFSVSAEMGDAGDLVEIHNG